MRNDESFLTAINRTSFDIETGRDSQRSERFFDVVSEPNKSLDNKMFESCISIKSNLGNYENDKDVSVPLVTNVSFGENISKDIKKSN